MWYVYILKCSDDSLYTGITNNVEDRVNRHNEKKGAIYTRGRTPVELLYQEVQPDKSSALKREIAIKRLTRPEKMNLIKGCY